MGAIVVSIFVSVLAIGSLIYFKVQEKKEEKRLQEKR